MHINVRASGCGGESACNPQIVKVTPCVIIENGIIPCCTVSLIHKPQRRITV